MAPVRLPTVKQKTGIYPRGDHILRQRLELAPPAVTSLMVVLLLLVTAMMPASASAAGPWLCSMSAMRAGSTSLWTVASPSVCAERDPN